MKFLSTFTEEAQSHPCNLWAVCYPEDSKGGKLYSIFDKCMNDWSNTDYLFSFFKKYGSYLRFPPWNNMSLDRAMEQVGEERWDFEEELKNIELRKPGYENYTMDDVFVQLHTPEFIIKGCNSEHKKAKPYFRNSMLRLYAIQLPDRTHIITGGAIKLPMKMKGTYLEAELKQLDRVQQFIDKHKISSWSELI